MKNVGLVTWYRGTNYGSTLQAYSLRRVLEGLGSQVRFIRSFERPFSIKNIKINLFSRYGIRRHNPVDDCPFPAERARFASFIGEFFPESLPVSACGYKRLLRKTDVFMSGGDQIWNCRHGFDPFLFLDFAADVRRVSYSSSIGTGDIPSEYRERVKSLLEKYSHIGVREKSAEKVLSELSGRKDIRTVLDPVFLLSAEDWAAFAKEASCLYEAGRPYVFCYFVGKASQHAEALARVKELSGAETAVLLPSNDYPLEILDGAVRMEDAGPMEFVHLLSGAEAVLTDSFHGSALSLRLGKQFYNVKRFADNDPASQNSRLYDLCSLFGIGGRFLEEGTPAAIDYKKTDIRIEELRQESLAFLKEELG